VIQDLRPNYLEISFSEKKGKFFGGRVREQPVLYNGMIYAHP
jgi:hypothetical protein